MSLPTLRDYQWRVTWPGEGHQDWSCWDDEIRVGRVMLDLTNHTHKGWLMWSGGAAQYVGFRRRIMPHQGWEKEHWWAAMVLENWYDRMRAANRLPPRK